MVGHDPNNYGYHESVKDIVFMEIDDKFIGQIH